MGNKLILPKQTSTSDVFYNSLKIFYDAYKSGHAWVSNKDYSALITVACPKLRGKNGAQIVKQSELVRYFGLAEHDYKKNRTRITPRGINFYELYLKGKKNDTVDILFESVLKDSFGRNNTAIKKSDSDIDPPKLLLRSLYDLGYIDRTDFEYLLYGTHDKNYDYSSVVANLKSLESTLVLPKTAHNKYHDVKFIPFFVKEGLIDENKRKLYLSSYLKGKYSSQLKTMPITNVATKKGGLIIVSPIKTTITRTEDEDDINQEEITKAKAYDKTDPKFKKDNNRAPELVSAGKGRSKYKTLKRISKTALKEAGYKCEYENKHTTFLTPKGEQFTEAHHLIPMCAQKDFSINLDRVENIVSLCPNCHSAIHLGSTAVTKAYLKKLFTAREPALKKAGIAITFNDLWNKYYK